MLLDLRLPQSLRDALQVAQKRMSAEFAVDRIILFGSVVCEETDEEFGAVLSAHQLISGA